MKSMWLRLLADETGVVLSSEIALVGTVGVLGMVVGLESVASSVNNELNDLASAFGALDQSYGYRSMAKFGHAWVRGSGFYDRGDYCDCIGITQVEVMGKSGDCGLPENATQQPPVVSTAPIVREQIVDESVVAPPPCCPEVPNFPVDNGQIIRPRGHLESDRPMPVAPHMKSHKPRPLPIPPQPENPKEPPQR